MLRATLLALLGLLLQYTHADSPTRASNGHGEPRISFRSREGWFKDGGLNEIYMKYDSSPTRDRWMNIICDAIDLADGDEVLSRMWEYWLDSPPHQRGFTSNTEYARDLTISGAELSLSKFDSRTPTRYRCKINTRLVGSIDRQLYIYGQPTEITEEAEETYKNDDGHYRELKLTCGRSVQTYQNFDWYHNGHKLHDDDYDVEIERQHDSNIARGTLRRRRPHAGLYRCTVRDNNGTIISNHMARITGPPNVIHEHSSYNVAEGTKKVEMQCMVTGGSPIDQAMQWFFEKEEGVWVNIVDKLRPGKVELSENKYHLKNAKLVLHDLTETDRSKFKCSYANNDGEGHAEVMLRVKGRLAVLWPALGILAEIALLIIVILIFERRSLRKHRELEEQERTEREGLTTPSSKRTGNS